MPTLTTTRKGKPAGNNGYAPGGQPSSVDRLRMREMFVFKRTIIGKTPARRIAAERCGAFKKIERLNKILNIITILTQIGFTLIAMIILYMIFAISDNRGGVDEIIGIAIFQPIMAIIFSVATIFVCGLIGLPIRINKKLNKLWRTKFYVSIILSFIGLILCIFSFLPTFVQQVSYEVDGYTEMVTIPNTFLAITGWFLTAFGILHLFPPYKLQLKLTNWLNRKFNRVKVPRSV